MFSIYLFILKLLLLAFGAALIYAAYENYRILYYLPAVKKLRKQFGDQGTRSIVFISGLFIDIVAIAWIF